jgi:hypothetical protein
MNIKKIVIILLVGLVVFIPLSSAQLSLGPQANQELIEVNLDGEGIVSVKHIIRSSNVPTSLILFSGTISNLAIINEKNEEVEPIVYDDGTGMKTLTLLPSKTKIIVEYNLEDELLINENLASIAISYHKEFSIKFSDEINLILVNTNPIFLEDKKGINVVGGGTMNLEYYLKVPKIIENVQWEENKFNVEIISDTEVSNFNFEQTEKSINFEIKEEGKIITLTMPEILLGGPYVTLLGHEKIQHSKWIDEEKNVSITIKPESTGQVTIIGTTVIPEFSMFIPLIMGFLVVLTVPFMKKFSLH